MIPASVSATHNLRQCVDTTGEVWCVISNEAPIEHKFVLNCMVTLQLPARDIRCLMPLCLIVVFLFALCS